MPTTEMIAFVAAVAALALGFIALLRLLATIVTHKTIRQVVEADPSHAGTRLAQLTERKEGPGDDRLGIILLAVGFAVLGASFTAGSTGGWTDYGVGASLFPLLTGAALCLRHFIITRAQRRGAGK